jgi:hypothetical protein
VPHRSPRKQDLLLLDRHEAVPPELVARARRAISRLGTSRLRASYFTTYWLPRGEIAASSPLEQLVAQLWTVARPPRSCAGVEWWIGRAYTNALPIGFHFDQDVKAKRGFRHPLLSSVFFFNRVRGGQLAITDQVPRRRRGATSPHPPQATQLAVVEPRRNRYVVFGGDRFHGVLDHRGCTPGAPSRTPRGRLRVTLVVNFWEHRPTGVPRYDAARG